MSHAKVADGSKNHGWNEAQRRRFIWFAAFVIMSIFLVKDELREKLKFATESVFKAQDAFTSHEDTVHVLSGLMYLSREILAVGRVAKTDKSNLRQWLDQFEQDRVYMVQYRVQSGLTNVDQLLSTLPYDAGLRQRYDDLKQKSTNLSGDPHQQMDQVIRLVMPLKELCRQVLEKAEKRKAQCAFRYNISVWTSYVLYVLGWIVALIAKLYKLDTADE